ncbi:sigma-70 family RNA polymerase sigma factor [Lactococcus garvieae subsp. garvieae]|uniref:sigma-70 family RNA polymerase sigma factor n=1 Tax=Lactococcus garvieae TaxID=1363 RepID=UPI0005A84889|nr:sigma-70 family RNA polymerase sigma factor [Lactococcus garvieae]KAA8710630.1 sigma-70 family RNA polymerase sigma factor [Lactococcus garvieae subsp. garvieae]MDG6191299.1 sigma-70 family RNA polymerase sigma factor [Lactococcus garvieae]QPR49449.1 sigma-70 family RNA polymerase sigma factor [Lactococcus garvieae]
MSNYKFLIRFYLLGFIQESTSRAEKFVERFGGDDTNVKKNRQTIDKLDEIFNPLSDQVLELLRLRFVDELKINEVAELTGLTYNKVYRLCADPIREVKKLAKEYYKK